MGLALCCRHAGRCIAIRHLQGEKISDLYRPRYERWHEIVLSRSRRRWDELLADDVTSFAHRPCATAGPRQDQALSQRSACRAGWVALSLYRRMDRQSSAALEFTTRLDQIEVDGVDIIGWNAEEKLSASEVIVRPFQAIQAIHQKMAAMLHRCNSNSNDAPSRSPAAWKRETRRMMGSAPSDWCWRSAKPTYQSATRAARVIRACQQPHSFI